MNDSRGLFADLPRQVGDEVVAVQMDLVDHVADLVALEQLLLHVGVARDREQGRQPVVRRDDIVGYRAGFDVPGPPDHRRHAVGAFPVRVLLAAERRHRAVRPAVHVRAVVGRVHDERVVRDLEIVQHLEDLADVLVVVDHGVVVRALESSRLADALRLGVGAEVHVGEVHPHEGRLAGRVHPLDEVHRAGGDVVVDGLHPLRGQRAGVLARPACRPCRSAGPQSRSSVAEALQSSTPRGPNFARKAGSFG